MFRVRTGDDVRTLSAFVTRPDGNVLLLEYCPGAETFATVFDATYDLQGHKTSGPGPRWLDDLSFAGRSATDRGDGAAAASYVRCEYGAKSNASFSAEMFLQFSWDDAGSQEGQFVAVKGWLDRANERICRDQACTTTVAGKFPTPMPEPKSQTWIAKVRYGRLQDFVPM